VTPKELLHPCLRYWKRILQEFRGNTVVLMAIEALGGIPLLVADVEAVCYKMVVKLE